MTSELGEKMPETVSEINKYILLYAHCKIQALIFPKIILLFPSDDTVSDLLNIFIIQVPIVRLKRETREKEATKYLKYTIIPHSNGSP